MGSQQIERSERDPVRQFSVFAENKVGKLLEIIKLLGDHDIHVMALTTLDTTDSSIVRMVVDDPAKTESLFEEHMIHSVQTEVLAVEMLAVTDLPRVFASLLQAEVNIHTVYSFISRPDDKTAMVIHSEDMELGESCLQRSGFKVLQQGDISR